MSPQEFWLLYIALAQKPSDRSGSSPGGLMSRATFNSLRAMLEPSGSEQWPSP